MLDDLDHLRTKSNLLQLLTHYVHSPNPTELFGKTG